MSRKHDWFSENPPSDHVQKVMQRALPELQKNKSALQMPWFFARRWLVIYTSLAALAGFTLWMNYQEEANLQDKAGVLGWSEELDNLDMKTISEVDLHEDMDMLENMDALDRIQLVDEI